jgi:hypothetical protein
VAFSGLDSGPGHIAGDDRHNDVRARARCRSCDRERIRPAARTSAANAIGLLARKRLPMLGVNGKNASLQRGRIAVGYKRCRPLRKRTSFSKRLTTSLKLSDDGHLAAACPWMRFAEEAGMQLFSDPKSDLQNKARASLGDCSHMEAERIFYKAETGAAGERL